MQAITIFTRRNNPKLAIHPLAPLVRHGILTRQPGIQELGHVHVPTGWVRESREHRSKVQRFNAEDIRDLREFEYARLPSMQRRIRLLRLFSGGLQNPEVKCELFDVEYAEATVLELGAPFQAPLSDSGSTLVLAPLGRPGDRPGEKGDRLPRQGPDSVGELRGGSGTLRRGP